MKKKNFLVAVCMVGSLLFAGQLQAEWANSSLKLASVAMTPGGVEFTIKNNIAPECDNEFLVPIGHNDFNLMAAFLLTASAQKKKIDIDYDGECEVTSVKLF